MAHCTITTSCVAFVAGQRELTTVEPPIEDTIEITSEQRTRLNVPNGDFPIVLNLR